MTAPRVEVGLHQQVRGLSAENLTELPGTRVSGQMVKSICGGPSLDSQGLVEPCNTSSECFLLTTCVRPGQWAGEESAPPTKPSESPRARMNDDVAT